jgi:hypothetical protein
VDGPWRRGCGGGGPAQVIWEVISRLARAVKCVKKGIAGSAILLLEVCRKVNQRGIISIERSSD